MKQQKEDKKLEKFVAAVTQGKNVKANDLLEQILKEKVSKKLYDTLKS